MKFRGVEFYAVCHEGTGRVTYICDYEQRTLRSDTQAGIRAQIGRVLNGLPPCDCGICECRIPASPLGPPACSRGGPAMSREAMGWYCCPFFKPDLRRAL